MPVTVPHMNLSSKHLAFRLSKAAVQALGHCIYLYVYVLQFLFCILAVKPLFLMIQQAGTAVSSEYFHASFITTDIQRSFPSLTK